MKRLIAVLAVVSVSGSVQMARADVFDLGQGVKSLETVRVGDAGNTADTRYETPGYGSVAYSYNIGKYEVTAAQYCDFLNSVAAHDTHGLYNQFMAMDPNGCGIVQNGGPGNYTYTVDFSLANRPVNYVSYWDACRFANWLNNGQGNGDTETGTYTLNGYIGTYGTDIVRNAGARWAVTSEDEWYKAAYYKGGGTDAGYWDYMNQADFMDVTMANCADSVGHPADVGSYAFASAYGTFDQGGNVWEWNESVVGPGDGFVWHGNRGGAYNLSVAQYLNASFRHGCASPAWEGAVSGFRVSEVPEPSSLLAIAGGLVSLIGIRMRRA